TGSEQHTGRVAQVNAIDRRDRVKGKSRGVETELLQEVTVFIPIDVNLAGVGLYIGKPARFSDRLHQRQRFDVERDFRIKAKDVLIERSECGKRGSFTGDENHVIRSNEDIFAWVMYHTA